MNPTRILLIEDSPSDTLLVETALAEEKSFPHSLTPVKRLKEGLALLAGESFDVVLVDLGLPDSVGRATFEALHRRAPQLPIIVLTSDNDPDSALAVIKMGAQDYLPKTNFDRFSLVRTMNYAIERQRLVQQLREAMDKVKTLSGLLPICSGCKRIRDEKGSWSQIEIYVSQHTQASFSHGLCPECLPRFYEDAGLKAPDPTRESADF